MGVKGEVPRSDSPALAAHIALLWASIVSGDPAGALPAFYPLSSYEKVKAVAQYGIELQLGQLDAGIGSYGSPMPPLKGSGKAVFVARVNGKAVFERRAYAQTKVKLGLKPMRDLLGPGIGGHMRDDIRINYVDDKQATISITTRQSRIKALANEKRAAWWGWTAASVGLMAGYAREVYDQGLADYLVSLGIMSANAVAGMKRRVLRRAA